MVAVEWHHDPDMATVPKKSRSEYYGLETPMSSSILCPALLRSLIRIPLGSPFIHRRFAGLGTADMVVPAVENKAWHSSTTTPPFARMSRGWVVGVQCCETPASPVWDVVARYPQGQWRRMAASRHRSPAIRGQADRAGCMEKGYTEDTVAHQK